MKNQFLFLLAALCLCSACENNPMDDPRDQPTTTTTLDSDIDEDTTLEDIFSDPNVADYIVTDEDWRINAGLTIEPGVIIEFEAGVMLRVQFDDGYLVANGTSDKPIQFTGKIKTAGFWKGILFISEDVRNQLNHCIVEYAGGGELDGARIPKANIGVIGFAGRVGKLNIKNTIIRNSAGYGLAIDNNAEILGFSKNTFSNNSAAAIQISANEVSVLDNASDYSSSNGYNGVEILGGTLDQDTEQTWSDLGGEASYKLLDELKINSGLIISPNTTIQVDAAVPIIINYDDGYLTAIGTDEQPIVFEGEVNTAGFWKGILFNSEDVRNVMEYSIISDAGGGELGRRVSDANIGVTDFAGRAGQLIISNCNVTNSAACGISYYGDAKLNQSGNTFSNIALMDICN